LTAATVLPLLLLYSLSAYSAILVQILEVLRNNMVDHVDGEAE
jgi:hypothetical protein